MAAERLPQCAVPGRVNHAAATPKDKSTATRASATACVGKSDAGNVGRSQRQSTRHTAEAAADTGAPNHGHRPGQGRRRSIHTPIAASVGHVALPSAGELGGVIDPSFPQWTVHQQRSRKTRPSRPQFPCSLLPFDMDDAAEQADEISKRADVGVGHRMLGGPTTNPTARQEVAVASRQQVAEKHGSAGPHAGRTAGRPAGVSQLDRQAGMRRLTAAAAAQTRMRALTAPAAGGAGAAGMGLGTPPGKAAASTSASCPVNNAQPSHTDVRVRHTLSVHP